MLNFFGGFAILLLALTPVQALAYIGPGMGLGAAATVLGLFVAFILLLVGLIWLPIRRMLRQRKQKQQSQSNPSSTKL
jgi:membrane protein implicated in regulation of membrane protease activity